MVKFFKEAWWVRSQACCIIRTMAFFRSNYRLITRANVFSIGHTDANSCWHWRTTRVRLLTFHGDVTLHEDTTRVGYGVNWSCFRTAVRSFLTRFQLESSLRLSMTCRFRESGAGWHLYWIARYRLPWHYGSDQAASRSSVPRPSRVQSTTCMR